MARPTRATAQSEDATLESLTSRLDSAALLALRACDELDNLREVGLAYGCLEKLIAPAGSTDSEEIRATRGELGALVLLINAEFDRRIGLVDGAIRLVRETLDGC